MHAKAVELEATSIPIIELRRYACISLCYGRSINVRLPPQSCRCGGAVNDPIADIQATLPKRHRRLYSGLVQPLETLYEEHLSRACRPFVRVHADVC